MKIPKREPGERTEVHHLRIYLAVKIRLKQAAKEGRRRFADYLRLVLEAHVEALDEAGLLSLGGEDQAAEAEKRKLPKKMPIQWRKGEETMMCHFRLTPEVRSALKQRGDQVGRHLAEYMRLIFENHVVQLDRDYRRAQVAEPTVDGALAITEQHPAQLESFRPEVEPAGSSTETGVYHFRLPLAVAAALKQRAVESRRRFADYVRVLLEEYVEDFDRASRKEEPTSGGKENDVSHVESPPVAPSDEAPPTLTVEDEGALNQRIELAALTASVQAAVSHADQAAFYAFAQAFKVIVATHGVGKTSMALQGLNLPRYVQPVKVHTTWDEFVNRLLKKPGSDAAKSPLLDSTQGAEPKPPS